jgi:outer membrane receptor for ferrienterochelin and colicin
MDTDVTAYVIDYEMELWSNFTYLLDDPENGDQFEQLDDRTIFGANWTTSWEGTGGMRHSVGAGFRHDDIDAVGLFSTRERRRLSTTRLDQVKETSYSAWYELDWQISHHWRTVLGLRGDYYEFDVDADIAENAGDDSDSILSPKASLIYTLHENAELYLSGGLGFHSNDARGTTIRIDPGSGEAVDPVDPLVRSRGAEFGLRSSWIEGLNSSIVAWYLKLDSELLFVGDAGTTEASRASRRYGVEFNNFWELNDNWSFEADISWTDARFDDSAPEGNKIPGALEWVASGAVNARLENGVFGSFRIRYFGEAPLVEDGSVESDGSLMANLSMGWTNDTWRLQLDALNLFDSDDHDIDYFYASRLPGEPAEGVEDRHYHIFEPRQFRFRASYLF